MSGFQRVVGGPFLVSMLVIAGLAVSSAAGAAAGTVVINEIYYNPPDLTDDSNAEFVEIHNPGDTDVDLTGYTFDDSESVALGETAALSGVLPAGGYAIITPAGYDAVARWGVVPIATFEFGLSGGGEQLTIRDSLGAVVDEVLYDDKAPWPVLADGDGPSAELIDSLSDNAVPAAWADSVGGPTPAAINSATTSPPAAPITGVVATPFEPAVNQEVTVVAEVGGGETAPVLTYVVDFGLEVSVPMNDAGIAPDVTAGDGVFAATIPGQAAGELIRYRISAPATGQMFPAGDGRSYVGVVVDDPAEIPTGLVNLEWFIPEADFDSMFDDPSQDVTVEGSVLAIDGVVYDNMEVSIRGGTFARANLDKQGIGFDFASGVDFNNPALVPYPIDEFALIAERGFSFMRDVTAWDVYSDAGFPTVNAQHVRVQLNGEFYAIYRFSEKLDGTWRSENGFDGAFYKADDGAFRNPPTGFKKRQPDDGDLQPVLDLSAFLKSPSSLSKTNQFYDEIDVPNAVNMAAASILVAHLDSEIHNFNVVQDTAGTGLWEIYPWDLNFTWGIGVLGCEGGEGGLDDAFDELDLDCVNNPYFDSIMEIPEIEEMVWRRVRTLLDGSIESGKLEALMNSYSPSISSAEKDADNAAFSAVTQYNTTSKMMEKINGRRDGLLDAGNLPSTQTGSPGIVITELHHSPNTGVEFLELHNPTGNSVDLSGWAIDGIGLTIPGGAVLLAGEYLVLTESVVDFQAAYPTAPNVILIEFPNGLSGSGEDVEILDAAGVQVDLVDYLTAAPWPTEPNAGDVTLSLFEDEDDNAVPEAWGISVALGGTPGEANDTVVSDPVVPPNVVINEIHYNPADGGVQFIELYNAEGEVVDISGWDLDGMIEFAAGSTIPVDGYFVATADLALFQTLYPGVAAVEWVAGEDLKGGGEGVSLETDAGVVVDDLDYEDVAPWPTTPDGNGPSLELIDPALDNTEGANWEASLAMGSPGSTNMIVDTEAPETVIDTPTAGSLVSGDPLLVSGTASDDVGIGSVRVRFVRDADPTPNRSWQSWDGAGWVSGPTVWHPAEVDGNDWSLSMPVDVAVGGEPGVWVQALATDTSGNEDPSRASSFVDFASEDSTPPETVIDTPTAGSMVSGDPLLVVGSASDDVGIASVRVRFVRDADPTPNRAWQFWDGAGWVSGMSVWHVANLDGTDWSLSMVVDSDLDAGAQPGVWVQAVAVDTSGNEDPTRASSFVDFASEDSTPPETVIDVPVAGSLVSGDPLLVSGTASDDVGIGSVRVRFVRDADPTPNRSWQSWDGAGWVSGPTVWHPAEVDGNDWSLSMPVDVAVGGEPGVWVQALATDTSGNEDPSRASSFVTLN